MRAPRALITAHDRFPDLPAAGDAAVQVLLPGDHVDHPLARAQGQRDHPRLAAAGVELFGHQVAMGGPRDEPCRAPGARPGGSGPDRPPTLTRRARGQG